MRRNAKSRRMRSDHRRPADAQCVLHRIGRNVRNIDQHPQVVHLAHHIFAKRRQPSGARHVGGRINPIERIGMRQCHVSRAQAVQPAQRGQRVFDRVPPFDADQRGDLARAMNPLDVIGREGQLQIVGIAFDQAANQVDLLESHLGRFAGAHRLDRRIGGPELRPHSAAAQARQIGVEHRLRLRNVELREA